MLKLIALIFAKLHGLKRVEPIEMHISYRGHLFNIKGCIYHVERPPLGRFAGITIGHCIVYKRPNEITNTESSCIIYHEAIHIAQFIYYYPFFHILYLLSSLRQLVSGKPAYRNNAYEVEAYNAQYDCMRNGSMAYKNGRK